MKKNEYLCIGKIVGSRGVNGELKIDPWCDSPEDFFDIKIFFTDTNDSSLDIENLRVHKNQVLMKIKNINDKTSAENLRGKSVYAFKKDIPIDEGRYFIEDLKGCQVLDAKSKVIYGTLKDVLNTGASDIYSIGDSQNKEYLVPIIDGTIDKIDLENEQIFINPIQGVFDAD